MTFLVYAIRSEASSRIYIGQTADLARRLDLHMSGKVASTCKDRPWVLVKTQEFATRSEARWFEKQLKDSRGRREKWLNHTQAQ